MEQKSIKVFCVFTKKKSVKSEFINLKPKKSFSLTDTEGAVLGPAHSLKTNILIPCHVYIKMLF